ncbi:PucR family transcriptional regulator [Gordonia sp. VNK1]|uniref:PucR family transcriptional regulator n=1 Tax=Gordonia oleivorans TaxID=3156618 RepID=UPI0032B321A4
MPATSTTPPTLRQVIDRHLDRADPRVLTAHDRLDTAVTWVHSSEIFEIGPLLAGGELLLTTGLGLAGLDAGTRRHYVRDLADRGVAGLAFEIGRTFDAIPEEMIREGSAAHLPIVELRRVVPFIEVCRTANTAIVSDEVTDLRLRSELDALLHDDLTAPGATAAMIDHIAAATRCPIVLVGSGGALISTHGVDEDRAAWRAVDTAVASTPILVRGREIGRLYAGTAPAASSAASIDLLLRTGAGPLAAVLTRSGANRSSLGARLITDLVGRHPLRRADLLARLHGSGLAVSDTTVLVPVAAHSPDSRMADAALTRAASRLSGLIHATVDATTYALVAASADTTDPVTQVREALIEGGSQVVRFEAVVGDGHPVHGTGSGSGPASTLSDALHTCSERLDMAGDLRRIHGVVAGRELLVESTARSLPTPLRDELLGLIAPLTTHDAATSAQLVTTLDVHLRHGCSATRSAEELHIGRQSLYQRLDRIRGLLGFDPTAPAIYGSMLLAISTFQADSVRP